jgi:ABC-type branched-subunit amino acid transport system substrate-binding protein
MKRMLASSVVSVVAVVALVGATLRASKAEPGVSEREILLGQTMPYSGPVSPYGALGKAETAFFDMINDRGGINGRKVRLLSLDDAYSPPKTVEMTRKLVEDDGVLLMFGTLGTPGNAAVQRYLNQKKVPQLFIVSGADRFADPAQFPWTMPFYPAYRTEARIYARYILQHRPNARIAAIYQNDDFGKDYLRALESGLGGKASMLVARQAFELTDPTLDSQVIAARASGADVLMVFSTAKFAAQAIRKAGDMGWRPAFFLASAAAQTEATLKPAGLDRSVGVMSIAWLKDVSDAAWKEGADYRDWQDFMRRYYPLGNPADPNSVAGYVFGHAMVHVLAACGKAVTRDCVMDKAASLHDLRLPMVLPGLSFSTSRTDYRPLKQMRLQRFNGTSWDLLDEVISE